MWLVNVQSSSASSEKAIDDFSRDFVGSFAAHTLPQPVLCSGQRKTYQNMFIVEFSLSALETELSLVIGVGVLSEILLQNCRRLGKPWSPCFRGLVPMSFQIRKSVNANKSK